MTYKTIQELFDTASQHLLTQMKKSKEDRSCLYRGPNGLKCAVGVLIPDSAYTPDIENCPASSLFSKHRGVLEKSNIDPDSYESDLLLAELQSIHDMSDPIDWKVSLGLLAKRFRLTFQG